GPHRCRRRIRPRVAPRRGRAADRPAAPRARRARHRDADARPLRRRQGPRGTAARPGRGAAAPPDVRAAARGVLRPGLPGAAAARRRGAAGQVRALPATTRPHHHLGHGRPRRAPRGRRPPGRQLARAAARAGRLLGAAGTAHGDHRTPLLREVGQLRRPRRRVRRRGPAGRRRGAGGAERGRHLPQARRHRRRGGAALVPRPARERDAAARAAAGHREARTRGPGAHPAL
ncbi:MAG: DNA alkylation repair enzyme, partial [uncultured Nocardioides sp.]